MIATTRVAGCAVKRWLFHSSLSKQASWFYELYSTTSSRCVSSSHFLSWVYFFFLVMQLFHSGTKGSVH